MAGVIDVKFPFWPFFLMAILLAAGKTAGWFSVKWSTILVVALLPQVAVILFFGAMAALLVVVMFLALIGQVVDALDNPTRYR